MVNYAKTMMAVTIAGLVLASYGGEFTLKKADHEFLIKSGTLAWEMDAISFPDVRPKVQLKESESLIEPTMKLFCFGTKTEIPILIFKSSKGAKTFDRVVVDQANNSDFADDPVLTFGPDLPVDVKLQLKGRDVADYRIYLVNTPAKSGKEWDVALLPALWREGTVTLAGKSVRAVMQYSWHEWTLIIDCDGDGQLNLDRQSRSEWFQVTTYMRINNAFYKTVLGTSDNDLDFEPFNGPFGRLELTGEMIPKGNDVRVSLMLDIRTDVRRKRIDTDFIVQTVLTNQTFVVPAGEYAMGAGNIINPGKDDNPVRFDVNDYVFIRPDHLTTLNLGKPKEDLVVFQEGRTLWVNREMVFAGNPAVTYSMAPDEESKEQALTVDVVDASDPAKVIVGRTKMEYG